MIEWCARLLVCLGLCCGAGPALADVKNDEVVQAMKTVGTLYVDNQAHCLVTLVQTDKVVTAGHCVLDGDGSLPASFENWYVDFAGHNTVGVLDTATIPGFSYKSLSAAPISVLLEDIAVIKLDEHVDNPVANIMSFQEARDAHVWVPNDGDLNKCKAMQMPPVEVFHVDCAKEKGKSGTPIFRIENGRTHIVGVVSALDPLKGGVFAHTMKTTLSRLAWNIER